MEIENEASAAETTLEQEVPVTEAAVEEVQVLITEENWQEKTALNPDSLTAALETLIFMSERPISLAKLRDHIHPTFPLRVVHDSLIKLQQEYEAQHHGLRLQEVAEGYQFRTKATYAKYVSDLFKINSLTLSPVTLEVLAIIAYKQPVSKTDVEKIRGVDSSHIIRALMDKRLVKALGRGDDLGRPTMYGTTQEFLEIFNLPSLHDLPPEHELESLANKNDVGRISDIRNLIRADRTHFFTDELGELDALSESIKSISTDTDFTKTLHEEDKKREVASQDPQAAPSKSAFDLLEEFLVRKEIMDQNRLAAQSELLTSVAEPVVERVQLSEEVLELPTLGERPETITDEAKLQEALDEVFKNLQKDGNLFADEMAPEANLDDLENRLEQASEKLRLEAKEMGLDLDFFKEDLDKNSE